MFIKFAEILTCIGQVVQLGRMFHRRLLNAFVEFLKIYDFHDLRKTSEKVNVQLR